MRSPSKKSLKTRDGGDRFKVVVEVPRASQQQLPSGDDEDATAGKMQSILPPISQSQEELARINSSVDSAGLL